MAQQKRLLGMKEKFLLMVLVPVLGTFVVLGLYSKISMNAFGEKIGSEATTIVREMAEAAIIEKARAVAQQMELALRMYPNVPREEFNSHPVIQKLATQKVGLTGYTVLYSLPDEKSSGFITLVHPAKDLVGKDTHPLVQKRLGDRFQAFYTIHSAPKSGKEGAGYYPWKDEQGVERDKYMACVPVAGTKYAVSATTYLDEFLTPVKKVEGEIGQQIASIGMVHLATMVIGLLIFSGFVIFGIQRISRQIVRLTAAIGEVSMGKVDNEIAIVKSNDELQDLAEAFERMRTGVKFIMQKLEKSQKK